jgi:hypothetical protein
MDTSTQIKTDNLTNKEWEIVHSMAKAFAQQQEIIDRKNNKSSDGLKTELKKVVSYLYKTIQQGKSGEDFFMYLDILNTNSNCIWRSGQTPTYYNYVKQSCRDNLEDYQSNPRIILQILGWVVRLINYYKVDSKSLVSHNRSKPVPKGKQGISEKNKHQTSSNKNEDNRSSNPALMRGPRVSKIS